MQKRNAKTNLSSFSANDHVSSFNHVYILDLVYFIFDRTVFYGQYKCSGPGAVTKGRVKWSKELTSKQARPFSSISFIDGKDWL